LNLSGLAEHHKMNLEYSLKEKRDKRTHKDSGCSTILVEK
jgi:hypothetical protein